MIKLIMLGSAEQINASKWFTFKEFDDDSTGVSAEMTHNVLGLGGTQFGLQVVFARASMFLFLSTFHDSSRGSYLNHWLCQIGVRGILQLTCPTLGLSGSTCEVTFSLGDDNSDS